MSDSQWIMDYVFFIAAGAVFMLAMRRTFIATLLHAVSASFDTPTVILERTQNQFLWLLLACTGFFIMGLFFPVLRALVV